MSIVNRRNAVLGWGVWQVGKVAAKRKAKQAVEQPKDRGRTAVKIVPAVAAAGGALWFWRRRRGEDEPTK
jgi:hypothetical protein